MKRNAKTGKRIALLLMLLVMCCTVCQAENAEDDERSIWECFVCGGLSDWRYCPWCGAGKPISLIQCPNCKMMYHLDDNYVFCKSCGTYLHPEDTTGLSDAETIEIRLKLFMLYWRPHRNLDMLELCSPSWKEQQESANSAFFFLLGNRMAASYEIETMQISEDGKSCDIHMNCMIDKNNGKDPVPFRVSLTMVSENGEWYVDPATMVMEEMAGEE